MIRIKVSSIFVIVFISCLTVVTIETPSMTIQDFKTIMRTPINSVEKLARVYPKTAQEVQQRCQVGIALARCELQEILEQKQLTFENTMQALDISQARLSELSSIFNMLSYVTPDQPMSEVLRQASQEIQNASIDLYMNSDLYHLLQTYHDTVMPTEKLLPEDMLLLQDTLDGMKKSGLHLPQETISEVKDLQKALNQAKDDFMVNYNSADKSIVVALKDLDGVDQSVIDGFKKDGERYIVPCNPPTYIALMEQCHVAATRKKMFFEFQNLAYPANDVILKDILHKRHKLAQLLGYDCYAACDIDGTTAGSVDRVEQFLSELGKAASAKAAIEKDLLAKSLPDGVQLRADATFNPWDLSYVKNEYKKKHFAIDEAKIAQYFPVQKVIDGIFDIYQEFLGLEFKEIQPVWVWHPDVRLIEMYQKSTDKLLGYLFLDLHPRANKYKHACHYGHIPSYHHDGEYTPSVATIITNFAIPTADKPALLKHDEVVTFFHEFGHAMHNVLSKTKHVGHAGTSVKSDFVETPSQMFEEWMYQPEMLARVSEHYQTGEVLPQELIDQKIALKQFDSGYWVLRQVMLAQFALQLMQHKPLSYQPNALWKQLFDEHMTAFVGYEPVCWYTTFGHLVNGLYGSKYYGYAWTMVWARDLFSEIKASGFSPEYQQKVIRLLSAGGSVDPNDLMYEFLGREPNQEACLKDLGF
ncbi:Zn-dependent oligopeptidase [Candidatus Babeliales bacterium]|nr:Zn-dependent oligopeptidase [Candidatus Babeliales bacterium]